MSEKPVAGTEKCPECGARAKPREMCHRHPLDPRLKYGCHSYIASDGRFVESKECLEIQLAASKAERDKLQATVDEQFTELSHRETDIDAIREENEKLKAIIEKLPPNPRVCLCGSTRFMEAFFAAGWELTLLGQIVLSVGVCKHVDESGHGGEALGEDVAARLDELHKRKIDLADWVLVLNVEGYIGESTWSEVEYAYRTGKPVQCLFPDDLRSPHRIPPDPDDYPSWETIAAATREAAAAKDAPGDTP